LVSVKRSHYHILRKKWLKKHSLARKKLHQKHKEAIDWVIEKFPAKEKLASSAIGFLMLSSVIPTSTVLTTLAESNKEAEIVTEVDKTNELLGELNGVVGEKVLELSADEEAKISEILSRYFSANIKADINGLRLNRTFGVIGAEQHLVRFPGDSMAGHLDASEVDYKLIYSSGMAPGRGAWGYFAKSKEEFNNLDSERERWYIAVQTFAAPNYGGRLSEYRDFFKYRKMLVVNTKTGQAVVCDIADAGPAVWTGKHLGGSPEVMYQLGFAKGARKGPVLYFFIDDVDNKVALGPVKAQ